MSLGVYREVAKWTYPGAFFLRTGGRSDGVEAHDVAVDWDLTTSRTERGFFWLPDQPDRRIGGELAYSEAHGPTLSLDETLAGDPSAFAKGSIDYPIVLGVAAGAYVTLLNSIQTGFTFHLPGTGAETLRVGSALIGAHVVDEQPLFSSVNFNCSHLIDWLDPAGFDFSLRDKPRYWWRAEYEQPAPIDIYLLDGTLVQIVAVGTVSPRGQRFEATVDRMISVFPRAPKSVRDLVSDYVAPLRDLVSFATDVPSPFRSIGVRSVDVLRDVGGHWHAEQIQVLGDFIQPRQDLRDDTQVLPPFQLFAPSEVPGGIAALIPKWLQTYGTAREAINIYIGELFQPAYWFPTRVATMVQALEAYDRLNAGSPIDPNTQTRVVRILERLDQGDRDWLEPRLNHAAEPALGARLRRCVKRAQPVLHPMLDDKRAVVDALSAMRNAVAHPGDRTRVVDMGGGAMLRAYAWAKWIMIANLLLDFGMTSDAAAEALMDHQPFLRTLRQLGEWDKAEAGPPINGESTLAVNQGSDESGSNRGSDDGPLD